MKNLYRHYPVHANTACRLIKQGLNLRAFAILLIAVALHGCSSGSNQSSSAGGGSGQVPNDQGQPDNVSGPIANAGPDQVAIFGDTIVLDGTGSTDTVTTDLNYFWTLTKKPGGSSAVLNDRSLGMPFFIADVQGVYIAQLVVNNGAEFSQPDVVVIAATPQIPRVDAVPRLAPPDVIPEGMQVICIADPDEARGSVECPVLVYNGYTYWAYSFLDNRGAMGIVAYDDNGNVVAQWEREGARYIWQIDVNSDDATVIFRGQANRTVTMTWLELTL
ncbi:MAG: hypothetical protein AB8B87_23575 [Granulosicoccus sp.]